jgi:hypothetical protein
MEATMTTGQGLRAMGVAVGIAMINHSAFAFDLNGAWATDVAACGKIFQKNKDGGLSIAQGSDMFGSGFIAREDAIVGNNATCKVISRKIAGPITHLVAQCAAENVAFSTFQFSYRTDGDDKIVRIFPGIEELNVNYGRCKF